jgi:arabinan endo-1,5-alpha-L-arabinosidase
VNWGECCKGVYSTYNVRIGRSENITGPYLDKTGKDMLKDGGSVLLRSEGKFIGPGQVGIFTAGGREWISFHYEADPNFVPTLAIRPLNWDSSGWPVLGREPEISQFSASTRPGQ